MIKKLCLSGGGIKFLAYCGSLKALEEHNIAPTINEIIGTSAGSIFALLMAIGCTSEELEEIALTYDFSSFLDYNKINLVEDGKRLIEKYGICEGKNITEFCDNLVKKKLDIENITFMKLYEKTLKNITFKKIIT